MGSVIAVNLFHVELAHEGDGICGDDLAGHHDREAGRIRNHKVCRHQLRAFLEPVVNLLARQPDEFAIGVVVAHVKRLPHMALVAHALGFFAESIMEAAEVGQVRYVGHQRFHPRGKFRLLFAPPLGEALLDLAR